MLESENGFESHGIVDREYERPKSVRLEGLKL
jgi:hypothetical protein